MEPDTKRKREHWDQYTVYDRALITAKIEDRRVDFMLADGSEFTGCEIISVDRFAIFVTWQDGRSVWIHKGFITTTEIQA